MQTDMKKYKLIDNTRERSYEFHIDGEIARIDYAITPDGDIALTHTEVAEPLQGQGIGKALVEASLEDIESRGKKVVPICGFVRAYIRKHPQWKRIVAEQSVY
jgi:predicted GNAT family acetyltransferase